MIGLLIFGLFMPPLLLLAFIRPTPIFGMALLSIEGMIKGSGIPVALESSYLFLIFSISKSLNLEGSFIGGGY